MQTEYSVDFALTGSIAAIARWRGKRDKARSTEPTDPPGICPGLRWCKRRDVQRGAEDEQ